jgi:hypothetical protein
VLIAANLKEQNSCSDTVCSLEAHASPNLMPAYFNAEQCAPHNHFHTHKKGSRYFLMLFKIFMPFKNFHD